MSPSISDKSEQSSQDDGSPDQSPCNCDWCRLTQSRKGQWKVTRLELTGDAAYPYRVEGINLMDNGEPFYWRVPNLADPAYDLSAVAVPELTEPPPLDTDA
jgi:hypothetical protein